MSDLASTSGTGSPSLSSTLRQFRPRKRCSQQGTTTTTPLRDKSPEQRNEPNPPSSQNKDNILIPETPESTLKKAGRELAQSSGGECPDIQATCSTSEVVGRGVKRRQVPSSNSEGDESPNKLGRPINIPAKKTLQVECSLQDGVAKRYMTDRERSLKELREEFQTADIEAVLAALVACSWDVGLARMRLLNETHFGGGSQQSCQGSEERDVHRNTVLAALVACNWNVGQARAYLLNNPHLEGNSQQSGQGSDEGEVRPNLTDLSEALRKRGLCSDDLYVENLARNLSKLKYLRGFRQPQPNEASDDNNKDCCKENMDVKGLNEGQSTLSAFADPEQCEPPQNATRRVRLRIRRLESALKKAGRELVQSSRRDFPDIQATCSTSGLKGSELVGRGPKWKYVIPEGDEGIFRRKPPGRPKELGRLFTNPAKRNLQVECSVQDSLARQYMTDRERSLKELREEFKTIDIEAVLAALVACSWDVGLARTRLLNKIQFMGDSQQSNQGSEERIGEPNLAALSGVLRRQDGDSSCSEDMYVKNLKKGRPPKKAPEAYDNSDENSGTAEKERILKALGKEFNAADIVGCTVLSALVACNWDVEQARAHLLNKAHFRDHSQQSDQGSEERVFQPNLANLSGALEKRDDGVFCSKDIYVKNLQGGLSKVVFLGGFRQQEDDSDNEDCCDKNIYVKDLRGGLSKLDAFGEIEHCEPLQNTTHMS